MEENPFWPESRQDVSACSKSRVKSKQKLSYFDGIGRFKLNGISKDTKIVFKRNRKEAFLFFFLSVEFNEVK